MELFKIGMIWKLFGDTSLKNLKSTQKNIQFCQITRIGPIDSHCVYLHLYAHLLRYGFYFDWIVEVVGCKGGSHGINMAHELAAPAARHGSAMARLADEEWARSVLLFSFIQEHIGSFGPNLQNCALAAVVH